jgi:hypothetical protein
MRFAQSVSGIAPKDLRFGTDMAGRAARERACRQLQPATTGRRTHKCIFYGHDSQLRALGSRLVRAGFRRRSGSVRDTSRSESAALTGGVVRG